MMKHYTFIITILSLFLGIAANGQQFDHFSERIKKRGDFGSLRDKMERKIMAHEDYHPVPAQRNCGMQVIDSIMRLRFPQMESVEEFESKMSELVKAYQTSGYDRGAQSIITIPVVVHVVHNGQGVGSGPNISFAQIQSQIDVLNEDFRRMGAGVNNHPAGADTEIQFALARVNPDGAVLSEPGVNRVNGGRPSWDYDAVQSVLKPNTIWDPNRYLNMWTVNFGGDAENLLGYAQFPSLSELPGMPQNGGIAATDGVVMRFNAFGRTGNVQSPYDGGRTTTHEVGHWLGLRHIWGDGGCDVDDFCADTPNAGKPNYQCVQGNSCNTSSGDMIQNYMDYTPDFCMNLFTRDQKTRMRIVLDRSPRRKELLQSTVHLGGGSSSAPVVTFTADKNNICTGSSIQFNGQSPNSPTSWRWDFLDEGGTTLATFQQQNISIQFDFPGIYSVRLTATNATGSSTKLESNFIAVLSSQTFTQLVNRVESSNQDFQNWLVFNPDADRTFQVAPVSAYGEGSFSILMDNYSTEDDPGGTVDVLITPAMDFSANQNPYLYFDHAYAQFSNQYSDTLLVFVSLDCGNTFEPIYFRGGKDLATAPFTEDFFVPTANQWVANQIHLGALAGQPSVHFAFANFSGWGNNLYLDNIILFDGNSFTNTAPQAAIYAPARRICAGDFVAFQDYSSGFPVQWQWSFSGGLPSGSNQQHPFVRYTSPGLFSVNMTSANFLGSNSTSQSNYIEVVPLPTIAISASELPVCGGRPVILTATGAQRYEWYDQRSGNLIFEGPSIQATLFEDWIFEVRGYNALGCETSESFLVTVNAPNKPIINRQGNTLSAPFATAYQWYLNGSPIPENLGGRAQSIQIFATGVYLVEVSNASGCSALSDPVQADLSTSSTESSIFEQQFIIFPNPASQVCTLRGDHVLSGEYSIEILNNVGVLLQSEKIQVQTLSLLHSIDLSQLSSGIYFIQIKHKNLISTHKLLKL